MALAGAASDAAEALVDAARRVADGGHTGPAAALLVLAFEEAVKAQALGMWWLMSRFTTPGSILDPALLERVLARNHKVRHQFGAWQVSLAKLFEATAPTGGSFGPPDGLALEVDEKDLVQWARSADRLKQRGFYTDHAAGWSPQSVTMAELDQARQVVEPFVATTARQMQKWHEASAPKPEFMSRRISLPRS